MRPSNTTYFENLDATRFLGFFHVFLAHCFFTNNKSIEQSDAFGFATGAIRSGFLGLDYFFVLSAFLLTWLGLEERKSTGNFRPGLFLVRRGLRLWPLYFFLVAAVYLGYFFFNERLGLQPLPPISAYLLFWSNLFIAANGQNFLFLLVFFWSISVEEQFYLFWAAALRWLNKYLIPVCILMIIASLIFRAVYIRNDQMLVFHTISTLGNFGIGAMAAVLAFRYNVFTNLISQLTRFNIATIYFVFIILIIFYFRLFINPFSVIVEKIVFALFFAFVILEQSFSKNSLFKLGKIKWMNYLGQLSLGLYCFHGLVLTLALPLLKENGLTETAFQVFFQNPVIILIVTLLISIISYELVEKRIHGLRRHFYPPK